MMDVATFKIRFPEFRDVPDQLVTMVLAEAVPQVGVRWLERDRLPATLYLTAHILASQGEPERSKVAAGRATAREVKRRKVGDVETEFVVSSGSNGSSGGATATGYNSTIYGTQFAILRRRNFPSISVA